MNETKLQDHNNINTNNNNIINNDETNNEKKPPTTGESSNQEQFKSTKKWNDIINSFCSHMPLRRHWRNFRTYSDCFTASEAVDWICRYLKISPYFNHLNITRQNGIKVLQIFVKDKIIEDVRAGSENYNFKPFTDDDRIYRLCTNNPHYLNRSTTNTNINSSSTSTMSLSRTMSNLETQNTIETTKIDVDSVESSSSSSSSSSRVEKTSTKLLNRNYFNEKQLNIATNIIRKEFDLKKMDKTSIDLTKYRRISSTNELRLSATEATTVNATTIGDGRQTTTVGSKLKSTDTEVWSKMTKKMLESVLKKAILNTNLNTRLGVKSFNGCSVDEQMKDDDCVDYLNQLDIETGLKYAHVNSKRASLSPRSSLTSTSTLKRSNDIKIELNRLLGKKTFELLHDISGANICHNCSHVNKYGVVISTEDDLPMWVIKAMQTLLNWDKNGEKEFLKFNDVFKEIVEFYHSLEEPLLTKELSYLFVHILNLLLIKPDLNLKKPTRHQKSSSSVKSNDMLNVMSRQSSHATRRTINHVKFTAETKPTYQIDQLIRNLRSQLNSQKMQLTSATPSPNTSCSNQKLLDLITNASSMGKTGRTLSSPEAMDTFDSMETKLLENAKLPLAVIESNLMNDDVETALDGLSSLLNSCDTAGEQAPKERELQSLLLASIAQLEDCCDDCLTTFNEINQLLSVKTNNEFDEFLMDVSANELIDAETDQEHFIDYEHRNYEENLPNILAANATVACAGGAQRFAPSGGLFYNDNLNLVHDFPNDYEDEDLIDIDDDYEFKATNHINRHLENEFVLKRDANNMPDNSDSAQFNPTNKLLMKSLLDRKLRRNNSFRAAIENLSSKTSVTTLTPLMRSSTRGNSNDFNSKMFHHTDAQPWNEFKVPQLPVCRDDIDVRKRKAAHSSNDSIYEFSRSCTKPKSISTLNIGSPASSSDLIHPSPSLTCLSEANLVAKTRHLSNLSLNELGSVIKTSLEKNKPPPVDNESESLNVLRLSAQIDSDLFPILISSFRLLALMLPPNSRRKLHFLLRFLNRLKNTKSAGKYLVKQRFGDDPEKVADAVESVLLKSFVNSIVSRNRLLSVDELERELNKQLALKLSQILVNNYSEVMKIPDDLVTAVKQKLESSKDSAPASTGVNNFTENINVKPARKALNILGLNDTITFPSNFHNGTTSNKQNSMAAANETVLSAASLNQTAISTSSSSSRNHTTSNTFSKLFNKKKKENII